MSCVFANVVLDRASQGRLSGAAHGGSEHSAVHGVSHSSWPAFSTIDPLPAEEDGEQTEVDN